MCSPAVLDMATHGVRDALTNAAALAQRQDARVAQLAWLEGFPNI